MTPNRIILFFGPAVFLTLSAGPSAAQIVERRIAAPSDAAAIDALVKRIETLEGLVAQLQQQTAFIKSVNPLVLDASGAAVTIRSGQFSIEATSGFEIRAHSNATVRSGGLMTIDATGGVDLKGAVVKLNNGSRPVACGGAMLNATSASSSGRLEHSHPLAVPLPACSATVLVPPED